MERYIIVCDIPATSERYGKLITSLDKCESYIPVTESTWLVATNMSARELFLRLRIHTLAQDSIYLLRFDDAPEGFGPRSINQWLDRTERTPLRVVG